MLLQKLYISFRIICVLTDVQIIHVPIHPDTIMDAGFLTVCG